MQAFPPDSANNSLTGFGVASEKGDHSRLFGNRGEEAYSDFSMSAARRGSSDDVLKAGGNLRTTAFDPIARVEPVHGDETLGLGSSTFLDGAPASRKAILQQISETHQAEQQTEKGALGRKKSLSHKIRGLSGGRSRFNPDGSNRRRGSDEGAPYFDTRFSPTTPSPAIPRRQNENNPFFSADYDTAYDRKGESIESGMGRERAPSSPKRAPNAPITGAQSGDIGGESLLKRMRSLSKSKKKE